MKKIGLFYAAKAERTSWVAEKIQKEFGEDKIEVVAIEQAWQNDFAAYDCFIVGASTWFDGELPTYWDELLPELRTMELKGKKVAIVYYPDFLRKLKESFSDDFKTIFNDVKNSEILLLDDIGAETVTSWNRDEILGTILQYRMQEGLPTLFTSNLTISELEVHLASNDSEGRIKARRIIERIKFLTDNITMIAENRRK